MALGNAGFRDCGPAATVLPGVIKVQMRIHDQMDVGVAEALLREGFAERRRAFDGKDRMKLHPSLSPSPVSTNTFFPCALINRQVKLRGMRLCSSAGQQRSQSVLGTTPNMAPPSSRNRPSVTGWMWNAPVS